MGRRVRELEQAIGQKDVEIAQLRQRVNELDAIVMRYREQEFAIAGALTRAQTAAGKIVGEAEAEKAEILRRANEEKLEAEREARGMLADAERRAGIIEEDAKKKARETAARAEGFMAEYRASAGRLVAEFRRTAAMASEQAKRFAESMNALNLDQAVEITHEYDHLSTMDKTPAQDMPDDYVDPASLMRSIYNLEGRDLPGNEAEPEPEPEPVPEPELVPEPAFEPAPEPAPEPEPEPAIEEKREPAVDPFTLWARPAERPSGPEPAQPQKPAESAWEQPAVSLEKKDEGERIWTVEEIVERTNANDSEIDEELNAIIEDVLRGS